MHSHILLSSYWKWMVYRQGMNDGREGVCEVVSWELKKNLMADDHSLIPQLSNSHIPEAHFWPLSLLFSIPPPPSAAPLNIPQGLIDRRPSRAQWSCGWRCPAIWTLRRSNKLRWLLWTTYCRESAGTMIRGPQRSTAQRLRAYPYLHLITLLFQFADTFLGKALAWIIRGGLLFCQ